MSNYAGRFTLANQLRNLQWLSLILMALLLLEKLFALLATAYGIDMGDPKDPLYNPVQAVRDEVFKKAITVMVLLLAALTYIWASYEVFPSFVMHFSGVENGPYAVWGVIFVVLLQIANMAFCAQVTAGPIGMLNTLGAMEETPEVVLAKNTVGAHLFLVIMTIIAFVALLVIEGIIVSNREYWLDQNPPPEPEIYDRVYYVDRPVYVQPHPQQIAAAQAQQQQALAQQQAQMRAQQQAQAQAQAQRAQQQQAAAAQQQQQAAQ